MNELLIECLNIADRIINKNSNENDKFNLLFEDLSKQFNFGEHSVENKIKQSQLSERFTCSLCGCALKQYNITEFISHLKHSHKKEFETYCESKNADDMSFEQLMKIKNINSKATDYIRKIEYIQNKLENIYSINSDFMDGDDTVVKFYLKLCNKHFGHFKDCCKEVLNKFSYEEIQKLYWKIFWDNLKFE